MANEQSNETPQAPAGGPENSQQQPEAPKPQPPARETEKSDEGTDWKTESRKWEARAKENSTAAARLAEIEDANKTEAQRAADAQKAAEKRATQAEARALRREVALEHSLTKDDASLLDGITDEDAMRALAARLATPAPQPPAPPVGFGVDTTGRQASTQPNDDEIARAFFGV